MSLLRDKLGYSINNDDFRHGSHAAIPSISPQIPKQKSMSLVVIRLLLLSCAASGIFSLEAETYETSERDLTSEHGRRRYLLSTLGSIGGISGGGSGKGKLNDKATATYRIHRDWLPHEDIPHPELYYQDLDTGERQLIWAFDDTLPRDVLAGRPDVWLQTTFHVERDVDLLLPFLEHCSRLGIALDRMIFTLLASNLSTKELSQVQKALRLVGAVHHTLLLGEETLNMCRSRTYKKAVFEANLRATYSVPAKDWIIAVEGIELLQFHLPRCTGSNAVGGGSISQDEILKEEEDRSVSAEEFFETLELQGINWVAGLPIERLPSSSLEKINPSSTTNLSGLVHQFPLKCQFINSSFPADNYYQKVVAYRGYLRPDMSRRSIVSAEKAKSYFGSLDGGNASLRNKEKTKNFVSVYDLTPYSKYWEFYKTPLMVGNVYLWSERKADPTLVATIHRFHWHAGPNIQSFRASEAAGCEEKVENYDDIVYDRLLEAGKVDLSGGVGIECEKKEEALLVELPLRKEAALSLAALRNMH